MKYIFDTGRAGLHVAAYRTWRRITSGVVVALLLLLGFGSAVGWTLYFALLAIPVVLGSALLLTSGTAAVAVAFVFGATYFGRRLGTAAHHQGTWNIADHSDFLLLRIFDRPARHQTPKHLARAIEALLVSSAARSLLKRLELEEAAVIAAVGAQVIPQLSWEQFAAALWAEVTSLDQSVAFPEHAVAAVLLQPSLKGWLRSYDLQEQDIRVATWWLTSQRLAQREAARWWRAEQLLDFTGVGLSWTAGFTPLVDRLAHFPAEEAWDRVLIGRGEQVEQLITTLARQRQGNVLLVGQPGTGRLGVAIEMARRIRRGRAHPALNGRRVVYLHIGEILARGESTAGQLAAVAAVLAEMARAGNVVAVIDGIGSILGEGEGRINLRDVLVPFLSSPDVRVVVLVSNEEYHLRLKRNEEVTQYFEVVQMPTLSGEQTFKVLALATPYIERRTGVYLPYKTLRTVIEDTDGVLPATPYPERAFDVLEEALVVAAQQRKKKLTTDHIHGVVSRKVGMPIGRITSQEREHLLQLEERLHDRIVNQSTAVTAVSRAVIRARTGVRTAERPIAAFLFLGPTGVGKTETAKALAATYFGAPHYLVRFDMSEFQGSDAVAQLIGSVTAPVGRLTSAIADRPYTVVLLDEFEKSHHTVQQLFLQVFDEGRLTDVRGQVVSFKHAIIIATSNAGAEFIRQAVARGPLPEAFARDLRDHVLEQNIFRPELLNRFDGVITFTPLSVEHIHEVARRMLVTLNKRLDMEHGVTVAITADLLTFLVEIGYHPEFGARPMARAIQDTVEYAVAGRVIKGLITAGQELVITPAELRSLVATTQS